MRLEALSCVKNGKAFILMEKNKKQLRDNVSFVVIMLLVLGPIGFIFLWPSRKFSLAWKIILSILTGLLTYWSLAVGIKSSLKLLDQVRELIK